MRSCSICGKGYKKAKSRSHSMQSRIRQLHVNLQWTKIGSRRVKACTKCIKSISRGKLKTA